MSFLRAPNVQTWRYHFVGVETGLQTAAVRWIMGVLYNMFLTEGAGHGVDADIMKLKEENYEAFKAKVAAQIAELNE